MNIPSLFKKLSLLILHLLAIGTIAVVFWPLVSWYYNHRPLLGVDFYHTVTWSNFFKENLHIFQQNYLDFWYGGSPVNSYPVINWFRIFSISAQFLPIHSAIKFTSLGTFFLLLVFTYLGTYTLSRNAAVAVVLALLVASSSNMYGSLTWGGSLPYFANQLFFPLLLWIMASHLRSDNKRWYYLAIIVMGFAVIGHIGNASAFYLPSVLLLILFGMRRRPMGIKTRLKETVVFIFLLDVFIYRHLGQFWLNVIDAFGKLVSSFSLIKIPALTGTQPNQIEPAATSDIGVQIAQFYQNLFYRIFTDTNPWLLVGFVIVFGIFLVSIILSKHKKEAFGIVAWTLVCLYSVIHVYLNAHGISLLSQGWYRAFWQFPVTLAFLIASLIGFSQKAIGDYGKALTVSIFTLWTILATTVGVISYSSGDMQNTLATLESQSSPSSAYPEALNLFKSETEFERLKASLLPPWMDAQDKNYRFFTDDAQIIVWWNALFGIPQVRGYLDPPGNTSQHHLLDQAIAGNGLVENYKYDEEIARNMALYYLDWYAIKYFEGGHVSQSPNKAPSTYLEDAIAEQTDVETKGVYFLHATKSGKPEIWEDVTQYLKYYRFRDEVTSPIVSVSSAPTLACFCDIPAYESLIKILSMHNIHSRKLISLYIPDSVDSFSQEELKNFDMIVMSNYKYQNRSETFGLLGKYLEQGGKLIFDTGGEVKESQSTNLPEWFPFSQSTRRGLGTEWELETDTDNELFKDLDISAFSPPVFDNNEWNFSYPRGDVKEDSTVLLRQKNIPLLIKSQIGNGTLYWSGMNLIYHTQYYTNVAESKLFLNILESLVPQETHEYQKVNTTYIGSNVINIKTQTSGRGILVKRQMYDNWSIQIKGQNARIIKSGPSYPGFMYVPLKTQGSVEARLGYIGNHKIYFFWILTLITALFLLDSSLLNGSLLAKRVGKIGGVFRKRTASWWEKDEE